MSKFNVGDKVIVVDYQFGLKEMADMLGNVYEVKSARNDVYRLKGDPYHFGWLERWLSPADNFDITDSDLMNVLAGE